MQAERLAAAAGAVVDHAPAQFLDLKWLVEPDRVDLGFDLGLQRPPVGHRFSPSFLIGEGQSSHDRHPLGLLDGALPDGLTQSTQLGKVVLIDPGEFVNDRTFGDRAVGDAEGLARMALK